jgi:hypothetical protein
VDKQDAQPDKDSLSILSEDHSAAGENPLFCRSTQDMLDDPALPCLV